MGIRQLLEFSACFITTTTLALVPAYSEVEKPETRFDSYGDILSLGVQSRLGTNRFGHDESLRCMCVANDRKQIATATRRCLSIWNVADGKLVKQIPLAEDAEVGCIEFSPNDSLLAVGTKGAILLYSLDSTNEPHVLATVTNDPVSWLSFARSEGELIFKSRGSLAVRLVEISTGRIRVVTEAADAVAYDQKADLLAIAGNERVRLHSLSDETQKTSISFSSKVVLAVDFSDSGKKLGILFADLDGDFEDTKYRRRLKAVRVQIRGGDNWRSIHEVRQPLGGQSPRNCTLCLSSSGEKLSASVDGTAFVIDTLKKTEASTFAGKLPTFLSEGTLVTFNYNKVQLRGESGWRTLHEGHSITPIASLSPDGKHLISAGTDGLVCCWNIESSKLIWKYQQEGLLTFALACIDSSQLVTFHQTDLQLWDISSGRKLAKYEFSKEVSFSPKRVLTISPSKRWIGISRGNRISVLDSANLDQRTEFICEAGVSINDIAFSSNDRWMVSSANGSLAVWSLSTERKLKSFELEGHYLSAPRFYDNQFLLCNETETSSGNNSIAVWELCTGKKCGNISLKTTNISNTKTLPVSSSTQTLLYSSDTGRIFALCPFMAEAAGMGATEVPTVRAGPVIAADLSTIAVATPHGAIEIYNQDGLKDAKCVGDTSEKLLSEDFSVFWQRLASRDARDALNAMRDLISAGDTSVQMLESKLTLKTVEVSVLEKLIKALDSDSVAVRSEAMNALEKFGPAANPAIRTAIARDESSSVVYQLRQLLKRNESPFSDDPDEIRNIRGICVLRQIASPRAMNLIAKLTDSTGSGRDSQLVADISSPNKSNSRRKEASYGQSQ